MQENMDLRRLLKMKVVYTLELGDFPNEEEIKHLIEAHKVGGETSKDVSKLVREAMTKAHPAIKDIAVRFTEDLGVLIADVTAEAASELIASKITKILENKD